MSGLFVQPLPFTDAGSPAPVGGSVLALADDLPGHVWRGSTSSTIIIDLGANPVSYDYVALVGSNLRTTDTVTIQSGTSTSGTGAYAGGALPAFTGPKAAAATTDSIYPLVGGLRSERYIRIDISAPSHPDTYVQFFRLVVGASIVTPAIDYNAEIIAEDQSVITSGPGYRSVDRYSVFESIKFSIGWITDTLWHGSLWPMLRTIGSNSGVLMISDTTVPQYWQTMAVFGAITTKAGGKVESYNGWRIDGTILAYSA